jgi:hypothetical protein
MFLTVYTVVHTVISLVGIVSGFVVLFGLLAAKRLDGWTSVFLATTVATSVTGFGFPVDRFLPSHAVGLISLVAAVVALYFNVFVGIVQAFRRVAPLNALAPTQSEPPFQFAQLGALVLFVALGILAVIRFRPLTAGAPPALVP